MCYALPHVRHVTESKTVPRRGFAAICGSQVLDFGSLLVEFGFRIALVRGILDSLSCIPDFKAQVPDSTSKISPESGFPCHFNFQSKGKLPLRVVCYTAVFSVVTQRSSPHLPACVTTLKTTVYRPMPTLTLLYTIFDWKGTPFENLLSTNGTVPLLHTHNSLERCRAFNCWKWNVIKTSENHKIRIFIDFFTAINTSVCPWRSFYGRKHRFPYPFMYFN